MIDKLNKLKSICNVGVIGAGMFGFPFANYVACKGHNVKIFDSNTKVIDYIKKNKHHPIHFKDISIHENVILSNNLEDIVEKSTLLIMAVPSQVVRRASRDIAKYINSDKIILNLAKGLELDTNKRLSQVMNEEFDKSKHFVHLATLSGGMLASEFANEKPLFADIASNDISIAIALKSMLSSNRLFLKPTNDLVGTEIAGSIKNVIAIAYGMGDSLGYSISTLSGLITSASHEIMGLAYKLGAKRKTFLSSSYSWNSDLITTCLGSSRNKLFGQKIIELDSVLKAKQYMAQNNLTVEGIYSARAFYDISKQLNKKIPIINQVYKIIYNGKSPKKSVTDLIDIALNK